MNIQGMLYKATMSLASVAPAALLAPGRALFRATVGATITRGETFADVVYRGVSLRIPLAILTDRIAEAFENGVYELPEAMALSSVLKPSDVVFDVGSGLGFVAALAATTARDIKVYAFEANPELCEIAQETYRLSQVEVHQFNEVLSDQDGVIPFHIHRDFWSSSTIHWVGARIIEVPRVRLQRRIDELKPTVLIVDIEGGEAELFGWGDLSGVRAIIVEVHPHILGEAACARVLADIEALGFQCTKDFGSSGVKVLERKASPQ